MCEHEKRAWRLMERRIAERGLDATLEQKIEIHHLALMREDFWHALDFMVEWAIDVVLVARQDERRSA